MGYLKKFKYGLICFIQLSSDIDAIIGLGSTLEKFFRNSSFENFDVFIFNIEKLHFLLEALV